MMGMSGGYGTMGRSTFQPLHGGQQGYNHVQNQQKGQDMQGKGKVVDIGNHAFLSYSFFLVIA